MRSITYVSTDGLMASVPFELYDANGYPLVCQVEQLQGLGLRLNCVDWWLQAVIAGKSPDWAFEALQEAHADNHLVFLPPSEWHSRMAVLYSISAKGQSDPECWESMLAFIREGAING